jgi:hypothetical protein
LLPKWQGTKDGPELSWSAISALAATIAWLVYGIVSMTVAPSPVMSVGVAPADQMSVPRP